MKMLKWVGTWVAAVFIAGCGGGGGSAGTPPFGPSDPSISPTPTNLILQLDKASVGNSGSSGVAVTVIATDQNNNVVPAARVSISADADAIVIAQAASTDAGGKLLADVSVGSENRSNRTVTVKATSGSLVRTATFQVIGAKINSTVVGSQLIPGASGQVNYVLVDVNSNPMPAQPIAVTAFGSTVTGKTDQDGAFVFAFQAPQTNGVYSISATAGGASTEPPDRVKGDKVTVAAAISVDPVPPSSILSASVSANPSVVSVNTATTNNQSAIRALFLGANNRPIENVRVRFDLAGDANTIGGEFATGTSIVYSNATGVATSAYKPGARFSPTDGVTVRACYGYTDSDLAGGACLFSATASLTVVSEAISVAIGTNRLLIDNTLTYIQEFVVTVVDSSGRAKADVQITPSIDLLRFAKGQWNYATVGLVKAWVPAQTQSFTNSLDQPWYLEDPRPLAEQLAPNPIIDSRAACWNEDRNRNGVLESAEDSKLIPYSLASGGNGNGRLDPAKADVAISIPGSSRTDAAGKVVVQIEYAKNLGSWVEYKILVAASGIGGTEGRANWVDVLGVAIKDVNNEAQPPFQVSRYGKLSGCNNLQ